MYRRGETYPGNLCETMWIRMLRVGSRSVVLLSFTMIKGTGGIEL
jgi:hypothetical protein